MLCVGLAAGGCTVEPTTPTPARKAPAGAAPKARERANPGPAGVASPKPVSAQELPSTAAPIAAIDEPVEMLPVPEARHVELSAAAVTLADAGAEPRSALRLSPAKGDERTLTLTMRMTMGMKYGDKDVKPVELPPITVVMDTKVTEVKKTKLRYAYEVKSVDRDDTIKVSERMLAALNKAVEGMVDSKGSIQIDRQGTIVESSLGLPNLPTPGLRPSLAAFTQSFRQLYPVFPKEKVGAGAKWTNVEQFELSGIPVQQTSTYTLEARDGDALTLGVEVEQAAVGKAQPPEAIPMNVAAFGGKGEGTMSVDLGAIAPSKASSKAATSTASSIALGDESQSVRMDLLLDLSISSGAKSD